MVTALTRNWNFSQECVEDLFKSYKKKTRCEGISDSDVSDLSPAILDNLVRLSLIEIPQRRIADDKVYKQIEQHPIIQGLKLKTGNPHSFIKCTPKSFKLTNYGADFVNVVCKE